jgi:Protein of unknown function (DUF1549)/Protein of unknown function (DUF1553)
MNQIFHAGLRVSAWGPILVLGASIPSGCRTSQAIPSGTSSPPPPSASTAGNQARAEPPPRESHASPVLLSAADLDLLMDKRWESAHVLPAARSDDSEFLRRVTLDVAGRIPTLVEAEKFLADRAANKRERLVTDLLASPDYAQHWADVYLDLFIGRQFRKPRLEKTLDPRGYFLKAFRENRRLDRIAYEMLTFSGEILQNSPGIFLASHLKGGGPEMAASVTARLFMGIQIQCAQCHDHPYDARYKQEDFYGLVAYFARTKEKTSRTQERGGVRESALDTEPAAPGMAPASRALDGEAVDNKIYLVIDNPKGQAKFKRPGATEDTVVQPRFLGRVVPTVPGEVPRQTLARAVTESDLFGKTIVDRTWSQLFGAGIVEPWDDLGGEADAGHPPLLMRLAEDLRASNFDFKHLLRTLLLSRAYGLTSRAVPDLATAARPATADAGIGAQNGDARAGSTGAAGGDPTVAPTAAFARAAVRRLTPEQLFRSLLVATGADRMERPGGEDMEKKINRLLREYLFVFGDDEMAEINTFNGNIPQALLMWNGEIVNQGAKARAGGILAGILDGTPDPQARLLKMFMAAYARPPTDAERVRLLPALTEEKSGRARYEDLFFAMLTSTEMLTIH